MSIPTSVLSDLYLFRSVRDDHLQKLLSAATLVELPMGTPVFKQGGDADVAMLVIKGKLVVSVKSGGTMKEIGDVRPGEIVGETALFSRGGNRSATVVAAEESKAIVLSWDLLEQQANNRAIIALERHLLGTMARRIRNTNRIIKMAWKEADDNAPPKDRFAAIKTQLRSLFGGK